MSAKRVCLAGCLCLVVGVVGAQDKNADLAIVVNPASSMGNVTSAELRKIFKAERTRSPDGVKFALGVRSAGPERACALKNIFGMGSDADYEKFFLQAAFAGTVQAAPSSLPSAAAVVKFVSGTLGGISFLRATDADPAVKVLRVDGKLPGDPGYPLKIE